jgi:hypothetical protein
MANAIKLLVTSLVIFNTRIRAQTSSNLINHEMNFEASARPFHFIENDLTALSELPLEKLLKVKKSLNELKQVKFNVENVDNEERMESRIIHENGNLRRKSALALTDEHMFNR